MHVADMSRLVATITLSPQNVRSCLIHKVEDGEIVQMRRFLIAQWGKLRKQRRLHRFAHRKDEKWEQAMLIISKNIKAIRQELSTINARRRTKE